MAEPRRQFAIQIDRNSLIPGNFLGVDDIDEVTFSELPEVLSENVSAIYNDVSVPGRAHPFKTYAGGNSDIYQFTAKIYAEGEPVDPTAFRQFLGGALGLTGRFVPRSRAFLGIAGNFASRLEDAFSPSAGVDIAGTVFVEVAKKVALLKSLLKPQHDPSGRVFPPPKCFLKYGGNFFKVRGILRNLDLAFKGPWETEVALCFCVECTVTFEEADTPKSYSDVKSLTIAKRPQEDRGFFERLGLPTTPQDVLDVARSTLGL